MAKSRSELRNIIMIILYQMEIFKREKIEFDVHDIIKKNIEIENEFVESIVFGVVTYKEELDEIANGLIKDWDITRIDLAGASIIRMALYELKYTDTPEIVVINEAVELSKKYCDESVSKIINAILDKYIKS